MGVPEGGVGLMEGQRANVGGGVGGLQCTDVALGAHQKPKELIAGGDVGDGGERKHGKERAREGRPRTHLPWKSKRWVSASWYWSQSTVAPEEEDGANRIHCLESPLVGAKGDSVKANPTRARRGSSSKSGLFFMLQWCVAWKKGGRGVRISLLGGLVVGANEFAA